MHKRLILALAACAFLNSGPAMAVDRTHSFPSIDGGMVSLADWPGQPVLVVNTASRCGFTKQYAGLQALYDTYRDAGLVVLAVPSNDFRQELASEAEVKRFCDLQFDLTLPMTEITPVIGAKAHPFYRAVKSETGFAPAWNFNKILIGRDGAVVRSFGANVKPTAPKLRKAIEQALAQ